MSDSEIVYDKNGNATTFAGKDAVDMYAAASLKMHLKLYLQTGMIPTRGANLKFMNARAGQYTGKVYKGRKGAEQAIADLEQWVLAMKLALPSRVQK